MWKDLRGGGDGLIVGGYASGEPRYERVVTSVITAWRGGL